MLRALSLCTCCRHYPGAATERPACSFTQSYQPSPTWLSGRPAHRRFRGLLGVHSRYGLHTRAVTVFRDTLSEGFSHFVTSMTAPVASGWSVRRVGFATHWKAPPCHGAGAKQTLASGLPGEIMSSRPKQLPSRGGHGHASQRQRRVSHVTVEYHLSPAVLCERVADHSASGLVWVAAAAFVDPSTASISDMVGSKTFVYPDQHARLLRPWRIGLAVPCD